MQSSYPPPSLVKSDLLENRVQQRRMLNCVSSPRNVYNLCWWNMPSCLEPAYLLDWIENRNAKFLDVDALERLSNKEAFYVIDTGTKRPVCLFDYRKAEPNDIAVVWDWVIRYKRKPGESMKTAHPELVSLVKCEFFAVDAKASLLYQRKKVTRPLFVA
jgi:hypothetical protein